MISNALPSFWAAYRPLDKAVKRQAKKAYRLWAENPFHPSLHFKCINAEGGRANGIDGVGQGGSFKHSLNRAGQLIEREERAAEEPHGRDDEAGQQGLTD